ncbi:MAG: sodium:proton antiporter [Bacteroidales bacterium]|jgi:CPA1 family monovalent cation:H+ antiporter|nr:sodium:proton antiporter [Bacteroidales bacterium]
MELYSVVILLLAVVIAVSPVAAKMKIPYPVLLLVTGIAIGFLLPEFQHITINSEIVFLFFLPPMLYDAAYHINFKEFKINITTIFSLGITLVFLTVAGIAVIAHFCFPHLPWSLAFVLGAILAPPDAIAATSVTKGLGLPSRTVTVLEGESLINDASALSAFKFATAAVVGSKFAPSQAISFFLIALVGGFVLGWVLSRLFIWAAKKHWFDTNVIVSLNIMLPFVAYLLAEEFNISGVIAAVTVGLMVSANKEQFPVKAVIQSKSTLDTIVFILTGVVFTLIGIEFPRIISEIPSQKILSLIGAAFLIFFAAMLIRMLVIFWHKFRINRKYNKIKSRYDLMDEELKAAFQQKIEHKFSKHRHRDSNNTQTFKKRLQNLEQLLLSNREAFIIGWSGMRGIVSMACALSLPLVWSNNATFPLRNTVLFLTVSVVILMLVIQGLGLPLLLKLIKRKTKL